MQRKRLAHAHSQLAAHPRLHRALLGCIAVWKVVLGVISFKLIEVALHDPEYTNIGVAGLATIGTAFPGILLLWIGDE